MTRRRIVVLVVAAALVALGAVAVREVLRPPPWLVWARQPAADGELEVSEGRPDGPAATGDWSRSPEFGAFRLKRTDATPGWLQPVLWRVFRRAPFHTWGPAYETCGEEEPEFSDRWRLYVLSDPRPDDGRVDGECFGKWEVALPRAVRPHVFETVWSPIELLPDGTLRGERGSGTWREQDRALALWFDHDDSGFRGDGCGFTCVFALESTTVVTEQGRAAVYSGVDSDGDGTQLRRR